MMVVGTKTRKTRATLASIIVVAMAVAALFVAAGCGKKGPPVPPGAQVAPVHYSLNG